MIPPLRQRPEDIAALCKQYGIVRLEVLGSAATGHFNPEVSDIDLILDLGGYEPGVARRFFSFAEAIEKLLRRDVHLITKAQIRNPYFRLSVERSRELVHDRRDSEAVA